MEKLTVLADILICYYSVQTIYNRTDWSTAEGVSQHLENAFCQQLKSRSASLRPVVGRFFDPLNNKKMP